VPQRRTALLTLSRSRRSSGGRAWREADYEATDLETVIRDLLTGQYSNPIRVVAFNSPSAGRKMFPKTLLVNCAGAAIYRCASFPLRFLISSKGTRTAIGVS
jgi:hypothetical protein